MSFIAPGATDSTLAPALAIPPAEPVIPPPTATKTEVAADPEPGAAPPDSSLKTVPVKDEQNIQPPQSGKEEDEPHNALTMKFTEAEWTALKEFRTKLPDVLADAYPDKPDARTTPITMWGVTLNPNGPKEARASVVLMKFLRARNLNVSEAHDMLLSTLRWRDSFNLDAAMKEEFPSDIFGQLGHISGKDKEGRPVVYNIYGANKDMKAVFGDVQRFLRWRVAFMEKSVALLDFENIDQMVQIHDYEGVSMRSRDANSKSAASEATNIFQSHYPELLYKKFFVNVPSLMTWIFWLFKPLMSANTLAKMSVVGSGPQTIGKALLPFVDAKELPKRYGGTGDDLPTSADEKD